MSHFLFEMWLNIDTRKQHQTEGIKMFTYKVEMPNGTYKLSEAPRSIYEVALIVTRQWSKNTDYIVYLFENEKEAHRLAPYKRRKHNIFGVVTATTSIVPVKLTA